MVYFYNFVSKAFASYFYYFYFNNLLTNDKSSIDPNEQVKQVKKDYDENLMRLRKNIVS